MPLHPDDWTQLKTLFNAAIDRTGADRAAFLERASRDHPHLQAQLHALVASHTGADDFLEQPVVPSVSLAAGADVVGHDDDPHDALAVGDDLDDTYDVEARLGHGGMGVVYRVRHRALGRTFAAKLVHARTADDPAFLERFTREATALGKLKHPHIVDVTDFGVDRRGPPRPYLVMEHLEGRTLREHLESPPPGFDAVVRLFEAIAAAVDHAHEHGVLHLDLKPDNIVVIDGPDGQPLPKVLDFGLARFVTTGDDARAAAAPAPRAMGTPSYMAPELLSGPPPGPAADIYALGVVMFEALTGRCPFEGTTPQVLDAHQRQAPPAASSLNAALPPEVDAALAASLAKAPAARPATARAAVALVRDAVLAARQRAWRRTERPRRIAVAVGLAAVLWMSMPFWQARWIRDWEHQTVDRRFAIAPSRAPGAGVVLLLLDDASLAADATPLVQRADQFGRDLEQVFAAGARAVAVDFLLPQSWSQSTAFSQFALRHADRLTLAAFSSTSGDVVGPEAVAGVTTVALGPDRASALFGFVNLDQDGDGVSRRARTAYRDHAGAARPSFAGRAASTAGVDLAPHEAGAPGRDFWLDHRLDPARFPRVSWADLATTLRARPSVFQDRLVVVGADFTGSGDHARVPNRGDIPGVVLHALTVETMRSGFPVRDAPVSAATAAVAAFAGVGLVVLLVRRPYTAGTLAALVGAAYVAVALGLFLRWTVIMPIVGPLVGCGAAAALAWAARVARPAFPE